MSNAPSNQWDPGRLLQTSSGYWQTCTIHAAVKLDLFSAIGDDALSNAAVAEKLGTDVRGTTMLLNALCALGLLDKSDGNYRNTDFASTFLLKASPRYIGHLVMHHHFLLPSWARLDQGVRTGRPTRDRVSRADGERREAFLMGMHNSAMALAPRVVEEIDLGGRGRLLDLGGGPGTYAIHFCRRYPELEATVCDLPTTRPFAEGNIARFGLSDRIDFADLDYLSQEVPGSYDAAWLSHILHSEDPEQCRSMIGKTVKALLPGGLIAIHEFVLDDSGDGPLFPALFSLNMFLGTDGGQAYTEAEITRMLSDNGVGNIRRLPFRGPTDSSIIVGTV